jgi:hypothetical protein
MIARQFLGYKGAVVNSQGAAAPGIQSRDFLQSRAAATETAAPAGLSDGKCPFSRGLHPWLLTIAASRRKPLLPIGVHPNSVPPSTTFRPPPFDYSWPQSAITTLAVGWPDAVP